jgi:hypothetical protein
MRIALQVFVVLLSSSVVAFGQIAQGPAAGFVPSGVVVNTNSFENDNSPFPASGGKVHVHPIVPLREPPPDMAPPTGPEGSNLITDPSLAGMLMPPAPPPITIASFQGNGQTSGFPPDPDIAVGPNHIIQVVNSSFRISDKNGNTIKTINANSWYQSVLPNPGAFDPRIFYDFHASRWFMVWDNQNDATQTAYFLVSVSDDDDPTGVWFNWALPANVYGSTPSGTWQDHETAGFDKRAYYITGRHFGFVSGYFGNAVRILPKQYFLGSSPDTVKWYDFWALRDNSGFDVDAVRPAYVYSDPNEYYMAGPPGLTSASYFTVFRITNPLGVPSISCTHVPVTAFSNAPNAGQLGGGTAIETGGSRLRHPPVYRDSSLWMAHSINNGGYSAVRYLRINTATNTATEDAALGATGYWHFYPALAVDKDNNIAITFSRSGNDQYIGAYYTWRLNSDPPGLRPTETMRAGAGNYVVLGSGRNRWGDYMGAALDPADKNHLWMISEYASGTNSFAMWVNGVRLVPFPGRKLQTNRSSIDYGLVELGRTSDTTDVTITNIGAQTLTVSSISVSRPGYVLLNVPSLPVNLTSFQNIPLRVTFVPLAHGTVNDSIVIVSNDSLASTLKIPLRARGVYIGRARPGRMYATGVQPNGNLFAVNTSNGTPTLLGSHGITEIQGMAIHPVTREMYGVYFNGIVTNLYRMSADSGDALFLSTINLTNLGALAFQSDGTLYGATRTGGLYTINPQTGAATLIGTASGIAYGGIAFNPITGVLWGSVRPPITGRDRIYKVNTTDGQVTLVGSTGDGQITPSIAFDANGNLFGLKGSSATINSLISIDTATAAGTLIGSMGMSGLVALAQRTDSVTVGVEDGPGASLPGRFGLEQNYPNPFNPTTVIRYSLVTPGLTTLKVYNVLGQEVAILVNGMMPSGAHEVRWDPRDLTSGVYFYKLETEGAVDHQRTSIVRKLVLVR